MQMSCEPLPDNPMRPPSEPRKPLKPLDQAWVDDRWRQTLGIFELLRNQIVPYLMADAHQDTHAVAKRLLRGALKACIDKRKTVGDDIGSPASWGILLAQQARAELHGLEMDDEAGACTWPLSA